MKPQLNILIIDDNEDDRELYARHLRHNDKFDWVVYEAETGDEGLELYRSIQMHCVLLDYSLPGRDGLQILEELMSKYRHAPVIMLTGQGNERIATEAMKMGAQDYITKTSITPEAIKRATINTVERVNMLRKIDDQQEAQKAFAKVMAHDLKEPINVILGMNELVKLAVKNQDMDEIVEVSDYITASVSRMGELIDTLKSYNDATDMEIVFESCSLENVLKDVQHNLQLVIKDKNAVVTHDELPDVIGSAPQLVQLFQNIISNALKFCQAPAPQVHVSATETDQCWTISVKDNGIGIGSDFVKSIFEPSKRLHSHDEYPGTGLGLATCKKIIERHNGKIWCLSGEGDGTTFIFTLPKSLQRSDESDIQAA